MISKKRFISLHALDEEHVNDRMSTPQVQVLNYWEAPQKVF